MTSYLLGASVALLIYLSSYALVFTGLGLFGLFRRYRKGQLEPPSVQPEICVLIPSYNEGDGLVDAVSAIIGQDYSGYVEIRVIVNDYKDNSILPLFNHYNLSSNILDDCQFGPEGCLVWRQGKRHLRIVLSGLQTKKDKINQALTKLEFPYVALLDADHRPSPNWLSSSIALCPQTEDKTAGVQTRRQPLDTSHLAQIWDSSQNHLGNELVNSLLSRQGVFFTGTAAVFKTSILQKFLFSDSITEDTYLSYDLWCAGYRIAYNNQAASYEEVAPSFLAYISRRRRWSAGHNQSFFSHLKQILKAPLPLVSKIILLIHGQFYLIPLVVWLLLSIYGLYFFRQLASNLQIVIILVAALLSFILAYVFRTAKLLKFRFLGEWLVSFLWIAPQLATLAVYFYKIIGSERYYYILIFPYAHDWLIWQGFLLAAPLLALIGAWVYFKDARQGRIFWVVPTYIITLFLDIYAALLGFFDYLFGQAYWSKIERRNSYSQSLVPEEVSGSLVTGQVAKETNRAAYLIGVVVVVVFIITNDLLAVNNCGRIEPWLFKPLIIKPNFSLDLSIDFEQKIASPGLSRVVGTASVIKNENIPGPENLQLKTYLDGRLIEDREIYPGLTTVLDREYPLGWEKHELVVELAGEGIGRFSTCRRQSAFSTAVKELRGSDLYINDEKFLVKGIIPSFSNSQIGLNLEEGLKQIKEVGANTVRFYHGANDNLLSLAASNGLLVIDQPDRSTWGELDLGSDRQVRSYLERYQKLIRDHAGEPYILWDGLGNEWELGSRLKPGRAVTQVNNTIKVALAAASSPLSSYSTYYTFIKYPTSISGINMLDTGQTYWDKALNLVRRSGQPFYASEFGGFVAFWEKTDTELRLRRLVDEWPILLKAGAIGANFYQSHDNWAQPVVSGYNDPWQPEQPDDLRGFWNEKNQPKPELEVLSNLLSDLEIHWSSLLISDDGIAHLLVKNIRPYRLSGIKLEIGQDNISDFKSLAELEIGNLAVGEKREVELLLPDSIRRENSALFRFSYTTHSGLMGLSRVSLVLPNKNKTPLVLNKDFTISSNQDDDLKGRLVYSDKLQLLLPSDWPAFNLNGQRQENSGGLLEIPITNPYHQVNDSQWSRDGKSFTPFTSIKMADNGTYYLRFRWPDILAQKQALILTGVGNSQIEVTSGGQTRIFPTHNYRENYLSAQDLGWPKAGDIITVRIDRQQAAYISQAAIKDDLVGVDISLSKDMIIDLSPPIIFAPLDITIERLN